MVPVFDREMPFSRRVSVKCDTHLSKVHVAEARPVDVDRDVAVNWPLVRVHNLDDRHCKRERVEKEGGRRGAKREMGFM